MNWVEINKWMKLLFNSEIMNRYMNEWMNEWSEINVWMNEWMYVREIRRKSAKWNVKTRHGPTFDDIDVEAFNLAGHPRDLQEELLRHNDQQSLNLSSVIAHLVWLSDYMYECHNGCANYSCLPCSEIKWNKKGKMYSVYFCLFPYFLTYFTILHVWIACSVHVWLVCGVYVCMYVCI